MSQYSTENGIKLGYKKTGFKFECIAYADDIVFFAETLEMAIKQIEILKNMAAKAGLQISLEKS